MDRKKKKKPLSEGGSCARVYPGCAFVIYVIYVPFSERVGGISFGFPPSPPPPHANIAFIRWKGEKERKELFFSNHSKENTNSLKYTLATTPFENSNPTFNNTHVLPPPPPSLVFHGRFRLFPMLFLLFRSAFSLSYARIYLGGGRGVSTSFFSIFHFLF